MKSQIETSPRLLRLRQVLSLYPVSRSRWWDGVRHGEYPRPIRLSKRTTAWREQDVLDLIRRVTEARDVGGERA